MSRHLSLRTPWLSQYDASSIAQRVVDQNSQNSMLLANCKMRLDAVGHPGMFEIPHLTHYVLGHTKYFSGILKSMVE